MPRLPQLIAFAATTLPKPHGRGGISRRAALATAAAAAALGASDATLAASRKAESLAVPDLADPKANLQALLKILASTDERATTVSFSAGRVYACISERAPIPLFGTHSIGVARARARPDGSFLLRQHIVGFRTRFDTEAFIEEFVNPVTGENVRLPFTDYRVSDVDYRLDGTFARAQPAEIRINAAGPRPWTHHDGIVALSDDSMPAAPGPHQPKIDVVTRCATVRDLADPGVHSAASWFSFSAVDPFRPWLKMNVPGMQLWHVYGRKARTLADLPGYIRQVADERFPGLFELPYFSAADG
jgi:hypothetical protein